MTSIEAIGRAVAEELRVGNPDAWRPFESNIRAALKAFVDNLPPDLAEAVRAHLEKETTP